MELWLDFVDAITNNEDYRAGFSMALLLVGAIWLGWALLFRLYKRWLVMRQFFEPIKKPGKVPTETGPSPAGMLLGCLWPIAIIVVVIAIGYVIWLMNPPSS
jgi:hypothetical protein